MTILSFSYISDKILKKSMPLLKIILLIIPFINVCMRSYKKTSTLIVFIKDISS